MLSLIIILNNFNKENIMSELQNNTIEGKEDLSSNVDNLVNRRYIEEFLLIAEISTDVICSIFDGEHEWGLNEYEQQQSKEYLKIIRYYTNNNEAFYFAEEEKAKKEAIEKKAKSYHAGAKVPIMNGNVMININAIEDLKRNNYEYYDEHSLPSTKSDSDNAKKHYLNIKYGNECPHRIEIVGNRTLVRLFQDESFIENILSSVIGNIDCISDIDNNGNKTLKRAYNNRLNEIVNTLDKTEENSCGYIEIEYWRDLIKAKSQELLNYFKITGTTSQTQGKDIYDGWIRNVILKSLIDATGISPAKTTHNGRNEFIALITGTTTSGVNTDLSTYNPKKKTKEKKLGKVESKKLKEAIKTCKLLLGKDSGNNAVVEKMIKSLNDLIPDQFN